MRLIDADAEIVKIEKEIQKIESRIKEWEDNRKDRSIYNVDAKIQQFRMNISDARSEMRTLENYRTTYDVDKVVEQLKELRTPPENILYPFIWKEAVRQAIEIVKVGGVDVRVSKHHRIKILSIYFTDEKTFELRKDDRDYQVGDTVTLCEWIPENGYTGRRKTIKIKYVLRNCPEYGLMDGYCIFGW